MESSLLSPDHLQFLNQFWWSLFILIPMVLIARTVVAGTRYSPILIIVIFGLLMGFVLVSSGVSTAGLPDFPLLNILSRTTIVALAANFLVGGSLISGTLAIPGIAPVLLYDFFGQILWMFGGITALMLLANTAAVCNLAPGMAGALSHAGMTGTCTAGDLGKEAAHRAPVMINIPFFGHVFVFLLLALSIERGGLLVVPVALVGLVGLGLALLAFRTIRRAGGQERQEVTGLMLFSLGWQLTAVFGGLLLLSGQPLDFAGLAKSAALSHFGLFAAIQGGMFGAEAAGLIGFVFAMPFLVHPLVFFLFGRAMEKGGEMPRLPAYILAGVGLVGVLYGLLAL